MIIRLAGGKNPLHIEPASWVWILRHVSCSVLIFFENLNSHVWEQNVHYYVRYIYH